MKTVILLFSRSCEPRRDSGVNRIGAAVHRCAITTSGDLICGPEELKGSETENDLDRLLCTNQVGELVSSGPVER